MATVGGSAERNQDGDRPRANLRSLARESVLNLAGTFVGAVLTFTLPVVVTRRLSADEAGVFFEAIALCMLLVNFGTFGADTGVLRFLPPAVARGDATSIRAYLATSVRVPFVVASVAAFGLVLIAPSLASVVVHGEADHQSEMTHCLYVVAAFLPIAVCYTVAVAVTRGLGSIHVLVFADKIGKGLAQVGFVVVSAVLLGSAVGTVTAWLAAYVVLGIAVALWLVRFLRRTDQVDSELETTIRRENVVDFWKFAVPGAASRVCNVAMQRADVLLVGAMLGPADAAVYAVATRFLVLGTLLAQSIQQVMSPRISEALAADAVDDASEIYRTTTTWLTLLSWPVYLMAANFAGLLLGIFGEGYERGWPALVVLCLTMLVATSCGPIDAVLLMSGRSTMSLANALLALATMVVLDLVLIPQVGVAGGALGWSVAIIVKNLLALAQVRVALSMHPFERSLSLAMMCATVCFGAVPIVLVSVAGRNILMLGVASAMALVMYCFLLRALAGWLRLDILRHTSRGHGGRTDAKNGAKVPE